MIQHPPGGGSYTDLMHPYSFRQQRTRYATMQSQSRVCLTMLHIINSIRDITQSWVESGSSASVFVYWVIPNHFSKSLQVTPSELDETWFVSTTCGFMKPDKMLHSYVVWLPDYSAS